MDVIQWLQANRALLVLAVLVLAAFVILRRVIAGVVQLVKRRRPARLHPRLQKYGGLPPHEGARADESPDERLAASQIVATSTTDRIIGYEIIRQHETVFVDGLATPRQASDALKAAAARVGANAIINMSCEQTAGGYSATGDAVRVRPEPDGTWASDQRSD